MDRGAWQATVHGITKSQTWLSDYHFFISEDFETLPSISWNLFPDTKFNFWILMQITATLHKGFPGGSKSKEFACNAGYASSILGLEDPLENEMVVHSSILAWRIPCTEETGGMVHGSQRVGHNWINNTFTYFTHFIFYLIAHPFISLINLSSLQVPNAKAVLMSNTIGYKSINNKNSMKGDRTKCLLEAQNAQWSVGQLTLYPTKAILYM